MTTFLTVAQGLDLFLGSFDNSSLLLFEDSLQPSSISLIN
jgi:hypothetical protein